MDFAQDYSAALVVLWLVCGALTAYVASEKGYSPLIWMLIGIVSSVFGLIAAAGLPLAEAKRVIKHNEDETAVQGDREVRDLVARLNAKKV